MSNASASIASSSPASGRPGVAHLHPARIDSSIMGNKRGSPVLIEVLKGKPTFPGVGAHVPGASAGGVGTGVGASPPSPAKAPPPPVQPPIATYISERAPTQWPKVRDIRLTPRTLAIALGVLVPVLGLVWVVAFRSGQTVEKQKWDGWMVPNGANPGGPGGPSEPGPIPPDPLNNSRTEPLNGGATNPPGMDEPREPDGNAGATPAKVDANASPAALQDGMNHLVVGTFRRFTDAEASAKYLSSNRMTIIVTGPRGVDPTPRTTEWWVWIANGYERPMSSPEASRLRGRVVELGRLWKLQNKLAPTDFSQPYWAKYRKATGKD